jgi:hypothetical protein
MSRVQRNGSPRPYSKFSRSVNNIQNYCVSGLFVLEFLILENTMFRKLDLFPSSGEGRETSTLPGLLIEISSF